MIADITAFKMVELWGFVIPSATFIYALSFTARDLAHKQIGEKNTYALIFVAALVNVVMAGYFVFSAKLPSPVWFEYSEEYALVVGLVPRIAIASILAEMISQVLDTKVYQKWWERFPNAPQWTRVLVSNLVSLPFDSVIFVLVSFAGLYSGAELLALMVGQTTFKAVLAFVSMPLIYLIPQNPKYAVKQ